MDGRYKISCDTISKLNLEPYVQLRFMVKNFKNLLSKLIQCYVDLFRLHFPASSSEGKKKLVRKVKQA